MRAGAACLWLVGIGCSRGGGGASNADASLPSAVEGSAPMALAGSSSADARCPEGMRAVDGAPPGAAFCVDRGEVPLAEFNRCGPCVAAQGPLPGAAGRPARGVPLSIQRRFCAERGMRLLSDEEARAARVEPASADTGFRCSAVGTPPKPATRP